MPPIIMHNDTELRSMQYGVCMSQHFIVMHSVYWANTNVWYGLSVPAYMYMYVPTLYMYLPTICM